MESTCPGYESGYMDCAVQFMPLIQFYEVVYLISVGCIILDYRANLTFQAGTSLDQ
jgi:hypothetical protein